MQLPIRRAILIHGLPEGHTDPLAQLTSIESVLRSTQLITLPFAWGKEFGFFDTYNLLRRAEFGKTLAKRFDDWLRDNINDVEASDKLLVISYSIGGLILYRWLADHDLSREDNRRRIGLVVTIASPYQCLLRRVILEVPGGKPLRLEGINEPRVEPVEILSNLPVGALNVLLAEKDIAILPDDSDFLAGDPNTRGRVEQHVIKGATHLTKASSTLTSASTTPWCIENTTALYLELSSASRSATAA